jgi:L-seryl-tRNA(Ser) seleniumtransferase
MSFRNIPAVNELLAIPVVDELQAQYNRDFVITTLRQAVEDIRQEIRADGNTGDRESIKRRISNRLEHLIEVGVQGSLCRVINGTGVVLHTNLGRALIGQRALKKIMELGPYYNNLEIDLDSGARGSRYRHLEKLLQKLTGAEAGLVVNNNAAAVLLGLSTLAKDREVIVSRGQLIEIGGAFRIPEVMRLSGAKLVEVGTTNKTYLSDFADAITDNTALLFSAHTSNYKIVGFSQEVEINELVNLGNQRGIPVMHDLGSGILADLSGWGLQDEPTIQSCIKEGLDVVTFSGDKLLGGPQAGVIIGKKQLIDAMKKNQLTRALRVDKLTIAALEGTLLEYLTGDPLRDIPVLHMLTVPEEELFVKANQLTRNLKEAIFEKPHKVKIETVMIEDMVGGGAYPTYKLPGCGVELEFMDIDLETVAKRLREAKPALLIRRQQDKMLISVRTLLNEDVASVVDIFEAILQE